MPGGARKDRGEEVGGEEEAERGKEEGRDAALEEAGGTQARNSRNPEP
jgi:hypothetical protein